MRQLYRFLGWLLCIIPFSGLAQDRQVFLQQIIGNGITASSYTLLPGTTPGTGTNQWVNAQGYWQITPGNVGNFEIASAALDSPTITLSYYADSPLSIGAISFNAKSTFGGYTNWKATINGTVVATDTLFMDSIGSNTPLRNTGIVPLLVPMTGLTGAITIVYKFYGGVHAGNATLSINDAVIHGGVFVDVGLSPNAPTGVYVPTGSHNNPLPSPPDAFNDLSGLNFVRTWVPTKAVEDANDAMFTRAPAAALAYTTQLSTTYINGLGQSMESILRGNTVNNTVAVPDIVASYNNKASLTATSYLPYVSPQAKSRFRTDAFTEQASYYDANFSDEDGIGYSQTKQFFSSGNVATTYGFAPGYSFMGAGRHTTYESKLTESSDLIPQYRFSYGAPQSIGNYAPGQLSVSVTTDAAGGVVKEYHNKDGQLVCRKVYAGTNSNNTNYEYLTTYYVYDDLGRLRIIFPPLAVSKNSLGYPYNFRYAYDGYGNITRSYIPGKDISYGGEAYVYDNKRRPTMYQSQNMRIDEKYKFTIYDDRDRVVMTGTYTSNSTPEALQAFFNDPQFVIAGTIFDYILNGLPDPYPTSISGCEINAINYYDEYPSGAPAFDNTSATDLATLGVSSGVGTNMSPSVPFMLMQGMLTTSKTRVLDPGNVGNVPNEWITTTYFYDQKGQLIQTQTQNPWNDPGNGSALPDIGNAIYNFNGLQVRGSYMYHDDPSVSGNKPYTKIVKLYDYNAYNGNSLSSVRQSIDNGPYHTLSTYKYDDFGRVKEKKLGGVETQQYNYDIRGALAGINKNYVQSGCYSSQAGATTFGCILGYDLGFTRPRYDGKLAGIYWRGAGGCAPTQRTYAYEYDKADRLTDAYFNERETTPFWNTAWNHTDHDYTMTNVKYDAGGNMKSMKQRGTDNTGNPADMDRLAYEYDSYHGNRLLNVKDSVTADFNHGEFVDGNTSSYADYDYDNNGNLILDRNKNISSITYNDNDQPVTITFSNGNEIANVYDGGGTLVKRIITDAVNSTTHTLRYWGPFVYEDDDLSYIMHEDGRARWDAVNNKFNYDYFVKDHLGNVRTVVNAKGLDAANYMATYELGAANLENVQFTNIGGVRSTNPEGYSTNNTYAARLNGDPTDSPSKAIGTSILLHVMPGDKLEVSGLSYWEDDNEEHIYTTPSSMLDNLFSTLAGGEIGNYVPENSSYFEALGQATNSIGANLDAYQDIIEGVTDPAAPRAYINYVVFDEYMNMVPEKSGAIQVNATPGSWQTMGGSQTIDPGASGYVLVYLSNAQHLNVWFDNFNISFYKGELLQEEHYYPYGLNVNEGQDVNTPPNKFLFQGNERNRDFGLNLNDFNFRQYDAQTGRFTSTDLLADDGGQEMFSPYHFCANDPANFVDPWGLGIGPEDDPVATSEKSQNISNIDQTTSNNTGYEILALTPIQLNNLYMGSNGQDYAYTASTRSAPSIGPSKSSAYDFSWISRSTSGYYGQDSYKGGRVSSPGGTPGGGQSSYAAKAKYIAKGFYYAAGELNPTEAFVSSMYGAFTGTDYYTGDQALRSASFLAALMVVVPEVGSEASVELRMATRYNYRRNLIRLTGMNPRGFDAHHVFPQALERKFSQYFNIHDPKFLTWWEKSAHRSNRIKYHNAWVDFLDTNPSPSEILDFGRNIMSEYGIKVNY